MKATLLLGCLVFLLCGGFFLLLDVGPDDSQFESLPDPDPVEAPRPPDPSADPPPPPVPPAPSATEKEVAELIPDLASWRWNIREKALKRLIVLGPAARAALPAIEKLIEKGQGRTKWYAIAARMKIEGDRRDYALLAEMAANRVRSNPAISPFYVFDPERAHAVITAIRLRNRPVHPAGVEAFLQAMYESDAGGVAELNARLAAATPEERSGWLEILRSMRPMPEGVAPALKRALRTGDGKCRDEIIHLLARPRNDASRLRAEMVPFIRDMAEASDPVFRARLIGTLGNLGASDAASMRMLIAGLAGDTALADAAARSVARLGPGGAGAIDALIRAGKTREPGRRNGLLTALLATKDKRALPYLRELLLAGHVTERRTILAQIHQVEGAATLAPVFLSLHDELGAKDRFGAIHAAILSDPSLMRKETSVILARGLDDEKFRAFALHLVTKIKALTPTVVASLGRALAHAREDRLVKHSWDAITAVANFGASAEDLVPALLPHVDFALLQGAVVPALAKIDPRAKECILVFRRMATEGKSRTVREWSVRGLGEAETPMKEDVAALERVLASDADRYQRPARAASEILKRPEWAALRKQ